MIACVPTYLTVPVRAVPEAHCVPSSPFSDQVAPTTGTPVGMRDVGETGVPEPVVPRRDANSVMCALREAVCVSTTAAGVDVVPASVARLFATTVSGYEEPRVRFIGMSTYSAVEPLGFSMHTLDLVFGRAIMVPPTERLSQAEHETPSPFSPALQAQVKPPGGVGAGRVGMAVVRAGRALVDVRASGRAGAGVAARAGAAGEAAGRVRAGRERVAAAVVGRALVDVDAPGGAGAGVAARAGAAGEAAGRVRAGGERVAAAVVRCALVDVDASGGAAAGVAARAGAAGEAADRVRAGRCSASQPPLLVTHSSMSVQPVAPVPL